MDTHPACDPALELSTALWAVVTMVGGIVENADVPTRISEDLLEAMRAISWSLSSFLCKGFLVRGIC